MATVTLSKPAVIVRNEDPDPGGTVLEELRAEGLDVNIIDAHRGQSFPDLSDVSGVVLFGGAQHADDVDAHPYLRDEREFAARATDAGVPILGICLGGQILALAHGAALRPSPAIEFGYTEIRPTPEGRRDPIMSVWQEGDRVFHWHEDSFDLPSGATLLLESELVPNQAFRYGETSWGTQFHPEVTREVIDGWLRIVGDTQTKWGKTPDQIREEGRRYLAAEERRAREMVRRFAGLVRARARPVPTASRRG
jgi:GMP synthase-like glutamine amidotransferase